MGVNSDNFGLRTGSAFMLGELKCEKGVIPLMRMLKSEEREDARIVAALALLKIGEPRGIFAIKQAIRFDDSQRVRRLCANFYHSYIEKAAVIELLAHK
jgi:HEAT repeat protein